MSQLAEYWVRTVKADLKGFADPATPIEADANGTTLTTMWIQRGKEISATFTLSRDGDFRWEAPDGRMLTYRDFLASEGIADLKQLAALMLRQFASGTPNYVPTKAHFESDGASASPQVSDELILGKVDSYIKQSRERTQLVFLMGDAGSGKTTLLKELTRRQAQDYVNGRSAFLYLYVSAQGRALSNLRDAFSGELDDIRAAFTRDAVPPLVRRGILVPVIDGFDELLGAAGYGDAFGSLHDFLEEIQGQGVMVVAARSSFYDVEFLGRESVEAKTSSAYEISPLRLLPWSENELFTFLAKARGQQRILESDHRIISQLVEKDRALLQKPFFASLFTQYVDSRGLAPRTMSLLEYLVERYVRRESEKIVDRDGHPLLDPAGHKLFFVNTADSMWGVQKRVLSADDLRTLAEITAEQANLSGDSARQFVTKITSYAGFSTDAPGRERRFRFEHDVYFDHFLSEAIRRYFLERTPIGPFLDAALLPIEIADAAVDSALAESVLQELGRFDRGTVLQENRRRNAGTLAAAAFRKANAVKNRIFDLLEFVGVDLSNAVFENVDFRRCKFSNVRMVGTHLANCKATDCQFDALLVNQTTRLGIQGLVPGSNLISVFDLPRSKMVFSPAEMTDLMRSLSMPLPQEAGGAICYSRSAQAAIQLLQRVIQKYRTSNLLCEEDDELSQLFRNPQWRILRELLLSHGIVAPEKRDTSGRGKTFLRSMAPLTKLAGLEQESNLPNNNLGNFWRALRKLN